MSIQKLIPCLLGLFILALPSGQTLADDEAMPFVVIDVSDIVATPRGSVAPALGLPSPNHWSLKRPQWRMENNPLGDEQHPFIGGDSLVEWIHTFIDPAGWEQNHVSIEFNDGRLYVKNTNAVITKVRDAIEALRAEASSRVHLSLSMREGASASYPNVSGDVSLRDSASLELPPYTRGNVAQTHETRYVSDYEVEIAQGSNIANPTVTEALGGFVAELVASPTLDKDRILVEGIVQRGRISEMRTLTLGVDEEYLPRAYRSDTKWTNGTIQLPTYDGVAIVMTTVLPRGGRIEIPVADRYRQQTFQLQASLSGSGDVPSLIPVGALTRPLTGGNVMIPRVILDLQRGGHDEFDTHLGFHEDKGLRAGNADRLVDLVRQSGKEEIWETNFCDVLGSGDRLVLQADPSTREMVRAFIRAREQEALRPVSVDVRIYTTTEPFEAGPGKPVPQNATLLAGARVPTLFGRSAGLIAGSTANYLADYDVEVAQESRIADPIIEQAFDGLAFSVLPRNAVGSRTASVDVQLRFARRSLSENRHQTGTQYLGPLDLIVMDRRAVDSTLQMPIDGSYLIDAGLTAPTASQRIAIEIRLSRP